MKYVHYIFSRLYIDKAHNKSKNLSIGKLYQKKWILRLYINIYSENVGTLHDQSMEYHAN